MRTHRCCLAPPELGRFLLRLQNAARWQSWQVKQWSAVDQQGRAVTVSGGEQALSPVWLARASLLSQACECGVRQPCWKGRNSASCRVHPRFIPDRPRNLEPCCSGCHRHPHPGMCSACPRVPLPAAPSFTSHLLPQPCSAPLALAPTGLGLGGGHCLDLQQQVEAGCWECRN